MFGVGWGVHCKPVDVDNGVCEFYRPKRDDIPAARVPLRYDWNGGGGFYLDYILKNDIHLNTQDGWQVGLKTI